MVWLSNDLPSQSSNDFVNKILYLRYFDKRVDFFFFYNEASFMNLMSLLKVVAAFDLDFSATYI